MNEITPDQAITTAFTLGFLKGMVAGVIMGGLAAWMGVKSDFKKH